jgi:hypothetical protein
MNDDTGAELTRLREDLERLRELLAEVRPYVPGGQLARRVFEAIRETEEKK